MNLPGTLVPEGVDFTVVFTPTSLDFTPGSVTFEGTPIDFDGTEADFLGGFYVGTVHVPVDSGPATIPVTGAGLSKSTLVVADWNFDVGPLELGPAFSESNLDVVVPSAGTSSATTDNWNSPLIPELNGLSVTVEADFTIVNFDLINGTVDTQSQGSIFAPTVPILTLSTWGLLLLAAGIGGAAVTVLRRRRLQTVTSAA